MSWKAPLTPVHAGANRIQGASSLGREMPPCLCPRSELEAGGSPNGALLQAGLRGGGPGCVPSQGWCGAASPGKGGSVLSCGGPVHPEHRTSDCASLRRGGPRLVELLAGPLCAQHPACPSPPPEGWGDNGCGLLSELAVRLGVIYTQVWNPKVPHPKLSSGPWQIPQREPAMGPHTCLVAGQVSPSQVECFPQRDIVEADLRVKATTLECLVG